MNLAYELNVLKAMTAELPDYISSEVLFWPLSAPRDFPKLSLGLLLLTGVRLRAAEAALTPPQRFERDHTMIEAEAALARWPVAAENKAEKELRTRVNLWSAFLQESRESASNEAVDNYLSAATQRAIAALLLRRFTRLANSVEAQRLIPLDTAMRARLRLGPFLWDTAWQGEFPQTEFWFLYGRPA
jgi:hypothetical protein